MSGRRIKALDGVRGLAVLLVTISHAGFPLLKLGAIVGVTLFFALSGYLITGLLCDERERSGSVSLRGFYSRRAIRLLPALLVMLAMYLPLALLVGQPAGSTASAALLTLFYVNNLSSMIGITTTGLGHCWSLSLEEQFYLIWPALLLALWRFGRRTMLAVVLGLAALSLAVRAGYGWNNARAYEDAYYLPQASVWAILAGVALALAVRSGPHWRPPTWLADMSLLGLLATSSLLGMTRGVIHSGLNYPERLAAGPIASVLAVALIWAVTAGPAPTWLTNRVMVWFGTISYALYLWHDVLTGLLGQVHPMPGEFGHMVLGTIGAVLAVGTAWLSWRFIEQPASRLLRRQHSASAPDQRMPEAVTISGR